MDEYLDDARQMIPGRVAYRVGIRLRPKAIRRRGGSMVGCYERDVPGGTAKP